MLKLSTQRYVSPYNIALIYAGLDDRDKAFDWLKRGVEQRDPKMVIVKVDPKLKDLRDDPRYQDLLRRIGFVLHFEIEFAFQNCYSTFED